jgi:hypothetical protein
MTDKRRPADGERRKTILPGVKGCVLLVRALLVTTEQA